MDSSDFERHCRASTINKRDFVKDIHRKMSFITQHHDFESIFTRVSYISEKYCGIGQLSCYDISTSICKDILSLPIPNVYLCSHSTRNAVTKLRVLTREKQLGLYTVRYASLMDICRVLDRKGIKYRKAGIVATQIDSDPMETFLCRNRKRF